MPHHRVLRPSELLFLWCLLPRRFSKTKVLDLHILYSYSCFSSIDSLGLGPQSVHLKKNPARCWWLRPVILGTQEAEIRRFVVQIKPNSSQDPILKNPITKRAGGVAQGVGPDWVQAPIPQKIKTTTTKKPKCGLNVPTHPVLMWKS
jgi:hypothetical protein